MLEHREYVFFIGVQCRHCDSADVQIQEQLDALKPALDVAAAEIVADGERPNVSAEEYGAKQIKPLEIALAQRSEEIRRLMRKMETLSVRMDMTLEEREGGD